MGYFSVECLGCGHSLRSQEACESQSRWMTKAVAITPTGACVRGEYDGYGSILSPRTREGEGLLGYEPVAAYHVACWVLLGQPRNEERLSQGAHDQGFFCATQPPVPMTVEDLAQMRADSRSHKQMARDALEAAIDAIEAERLHAP